MIKGLTAEALQTFIKNEPEKKYLIVDVRQPEEYRLDHIPGSMNIPLAEIQFDPYSFEDDKKLIFCCTRGSRSKVAAIFVADAGYDDNNLFYLENGLFEYSGEILLDMPRVDLFPEDISPAATMETAINFEKGAFRFYSMAKETLSGTPLYPVIEKMIKEEIAHGKVIFKRFRNESGADMIFDDYFKNCQGNVLEGGKSFNEIASFLSESSSNPCMDILDFAIELENSAYDLYKTMAESSQVESLKEMFFGLAQAEKKHLDQMISALDLCKG